MRLATIFKTALVTTGLACSALGGAIISEKGDTVDPQASIRLHEGLHCENAANAGNGCTVLGYEAALAERNVKFDLAVGAAFFFMGTTLVATGLRRAKNPPLRLSI